MVKDSLNKVSNTVRRPKKQVSRQSESKRRK